MTSSWDDPLLRAFAEEAQGAEAECPSAADLFVAAVSGPELLPQPIAGHLLMQRCARCEEHLVRAWGKSAPLPHVLSAAAEWPEDSAMRAALDAHVSSCGHTACQVFAAEVAAGATAPDPGAAPQRKSLREWASELLERYGASLVPNGFRFPAPPAFQLNSDGTVAEETPRPGAEPGDFGPGVKLARDPGSTGKLRLTLDPAKVSGARGRSSIVLVIVGHGEPLADVRFPASTAPVHAVLDISPEMLESPDLRVAIGVPDA